MGNPHMIDTKSLLRAKLDDTAPLSLQQRHSAILDHIFYFQKYHREISGSCIPNIVGVKTGATQPPAP